MPAIVAELLIVASVGSPTRSWLRTTHGTATSTATPTTTAAASTRRRRSPDRPIALPAAISTRGMIASARVSMVNPSSTPTTIHRQVAGLSIATIAMSTAP